MSLCVYYGGDSGFEEKDALMQFFKTIDSKRFTVLITRVCKPTEQSSDSGFYPQANLSI